MASRPAMRKGYLPFSLYIRKAAAIACTADASPSDVSAGNGHHLWTANPSDALCCRTHARLQQVLLNAWPAATVPLQPSQMCAHEDGSYSYDPFASRGTLENPG